MLTTFSQIAQRQSVRVRASAVMVLGVALMALGVLLAVESMTVEEQMRTNYEEALALSYQVLETQAASAKLRNDHNTSARSLAKLTLLAPAATDAAALQASTLRLGAKLDEIASFRLFDIEQQQMINLKHVFSEIGDVNARLIAAYQRGDGNIDTARQLAFQSQQRFDRFDNSLLELVGAVRLRSVGTARHADRLNGVARSALMAFSAVTLALGILSVLLTLRTFNENRALGDRMQKLAREDALTGAVNRRGLDDALPIEFSRSQRSGEPLSVVMIDLDHFKRYNDRRGHPAGDAVLRGAAQAWLKQLRPTDLLARYGGEEFTLVLPGVGTEEAVHMVDRLRALVPDRQTFSAGVAAWDGNEAGPQVLQRADQALLQAKKAGRNRTMVAGREPQITLPLMVA